MDENAAVEASKTGDRQAFGLLIDRYYRGIYRFAYHFAGNHPDADDICQETFVRALDKIGGLRDGENFHGWVFTIAANLLRRQVRRSRRSRSMEEDPCRSDAEVACSGDGQVPSDRLIVEEDAAGIRRELEKMPEGVRMAAILTLMEGHSQKETAAIIGCSEATVCRHVESARALLRARLRHLIE
jgi:RNA polymerase sigma-70 factor, ECF subfamily